MGAITELAFDRLGAVGAISVNTSPTDAKWERGRILIDMAYEQVQSYLNLDDDALLDESAQRQGVVATVLAEMAGSRLQYPAAPSTEGAWPEGLMSSLMAPRHQRALDRAFRATTGAASLVVTRDEDSSWLRPYDLTDLWT